MAAIKFSHISIFCLLLINKGTMSETDSDEEEKNTTLVSNTNTTPEPMVKVEDLDWKVWCKFQPNTYDCLGTNHRETKYYFDTKMDDCKTFPFGHCTLAMNKFDSLSSCQLACRDVGSRKLHPMHNLTANVYCRLQQDFGNCNDYYPMYYFDIALQTCRGFSYSGCGGNFNRFENEQKCTATCSKAIEYNKV